MTSGAARPSRSASTGGGMSGVFTSNCGTAGSKSVIEVGTGARSYFGGRSDASARISTAPDDGSEHAGTAG